MKTGTKSTMAMKKNFYIITAAALSLVACSRNQEVDVPDANLSLFARTESPADTKTVVESEVHVFWEPGDEIAVFMGEQSAKFTTDITAASGTATFKGTFGDATWPEDLDLWAVYPFSEDALFDGETITTTLPSEQIAREGSFGKDMNLSIAHSNSSTLQFYNVGGGIRFSVTEEGIKKVMFEGLSGEIISGKVKIGFDNGLPVVKEVTGGSQFITLLPPTGQETFQPGVWYYIVAIPGSLEGGYKLRFYKDSDYARKVSEKVVQIKRSIFGSLDKADEGIEYEATTTHFPETKEEWKESIRLSYSVAEEFDDIKNAIINSGSSISIEDLRDRVSLIDGVIRVDVNDSENTLMVLQRDSIWVNYFLFNAILDEVEPNLSETMSSQIMSSRTAMKSMNSFSTQSTLPENYCGKKGKALILSPYRSSFTVRNQCNSEWHESVWKNDLVLMGFESDSIIVKPNKEADILQFKGDSLSKYDFIIIHTHGGTGYNMRYPNGIFIRQQTILSSSTIYDEKTIEDLLDSGKLRYDQIALGKPEGEKELHLGMTTSFLENTSFDNTCVLLGACESARILDNSNGGSMVQTLLDKGCTLVSGYKKEIATPVELWMTTLLLESMLEGMSFQDAAHYLKSSQMMYDFDEHLKGSGLYRWWLDEILSKDLSYIDHTLFDYFPKNGSPFFMLEWPPIESIIQDDAVIFHITFNGFIDHSISVEAEKDGFTFEYTHKDVLDIYVDDNLFEAAVTTDSESSVLHNPEPGEHKCYYLTRIMEGNTVIASYKSKESTFIIKDQQLSTPEAVDLGLPSGIKWASFNLGASKPEEYGDFFAWGETEPYYRSLDPLVWKPDKQYGYNWMHYKWAMGSETLLTKYCSDAAYGYNGFTDGKITLDPEDDAAQVNLGDKWRMPTRAEILELMNECSWEWTTMDGVGGQKVTGPSGEFIFLPAAGDWDGTSHLNDANSNNPNGALGFYASSSLSTGNPNQSYFLSFGSGGKACYSNSRALGFTIRPVYGDPVIPVDGEGNLDDIPGHNI